jgi:hypothetical protein
MNSLKKEIMEFIKNISDEELTENIKLRLKVKKLKDSIMNVQSFYYRGHQPDVLSYLNKDSFLNNK